MTCEHGEHIPNSGGQCWDCSTTAAKDYVAQKRAKEKYGKKEAMKWVLDCNKDETLIALRVPYDMRELARNVPGAKWDAKSKSWICPAGSIKTAQTLIPHWVTRSERFKDLYNRKLQAEADEIEVKHADFLDDIAKTAYRPWKHQLIAYHWFMRRADNARRYANFQMGMGTGKTKVAIDIMQNTPEIHRTLVVVPNGPMLDVWAEQLGVHWEGDDRPIPVVLKENSTAKRAAKLRKFLATGRDMMAVVSYDGVWRSELGELVRKQIWDLVICDESHRIKTHNSRVSKFMGTAHKWALHRMTLTGTPLTNRPLDAYGQFRFLHPAIFGTSYARFRSRYAIMGGFNNVEIKGYKNLEELRQIYHEHTYAVSRDVLDLPEVLHTDIPVELEDSAWRIYNELEAEFIAELKGGTITADNALVKIMRLQQITSGVVHADEGERVRVSTAKLDALTAILESLGDEPVVVFCRFHSDLDDIHEAAQQAGLKSSELSGRIKALDLWKSGGAQVLAAQIQSGGVGIDLTRARYCIYYSLTYSWGLYEQSLARVHRPGQLHPVQYIHLRAKNTIDGKIYGAIRKKGRLIDEITTADETDSSAVSEILEMFEE